MPEIQTIGETLSFFDKKFSHAVNKKPVDGDFRVQSLFGGQYTLVQPTTTLIEKAQKIVNTFPDHLLYASRRNIINSELHLMELNVLNPIYISISAKMHWNDLLTQLWN
jgi:hypothetical protein